MRRLTAMVAAVVALACAVCVRGEGKAEAGYGAGSTWATLKIGAVTYRDVKIKAVSARTVMIVHAGGMTSLRLRDLEPGWQARFGYDAEADRASEQGLRSAGGEQSGKSPTGAVKGKAASKMDEVRRAFGSAAGLQPEVDFRPQFRALELNAKNQGRRPSCSVFAVVSALEYQNAEAVGRAEKFSEEYLLWATTKTIRRVGAGEARGAEVADDDADAGFALAEVVAALRGYGIPLQSSMPNTFGRGGAAVSAPSTEVIEEARQRTQIAIEIVPGRDAVTRLNNLVHALNAGIPVVIGAAWPQFYNMRAALLGTQEPLAGSGHAVTLVGYTCASGRIEDARFIFKNSWGANWGANGYGYATYAYLAKHLHDAVILDVRRGG